jgi:hypothetical protein
MEPFIDVSPFVIMVDGYLEWGDYYIKDWGLDFVIFCAMVFGVILPLVITPMQLFSMVFFFPIWGGLIFINGPVTVGGLFWCVVLIWQVYVTVSNMLAPPTEEGGDAAAGDGGNAATGDAGDGGDAGDAGTGDAGGGEEGGGGV